MKTKKLTLSVLMILASSGIGLYFNNLSAQQTQTKKEMTQPMSTTTNNNMKLGAFSTSLNVKNLEVSKKFYTKLGFKVFAGSMKQNYLIMKNENALIGLFQGMFEGHILTFNPGWDENATNVEKFDDVREIQRHLKQNGIDLISEADEKTTGPASIMLTDPDGNTILIDQHR